MTDTRNTPERRTGRRGIYTGEGYQAPGQDGPGRKASRTQGRGKEPGGTEEHSAAGQNAEAQADSQVRRYRPGQWSEQEQAGRIGAEAPADSGRRTSRERQPDSTPESGSEKTQTVTLLERLKERRRRKLRRAMLIVFSVFAVIYAGVAVYFGFHFYNDTMIYGIDCSYKTVGQVKEEVTAKLGDYVLELQERDNRTETISAPQIGLTFTDNGSIDRMMKAQRSYIWPVMMLSGGTEADSVAFSYDQEKAKTVLEGLACMDSTQSIAPRDAYVGITDSGYQVVKEVMGTTLDHDRTVQAVLAALDAGEVSVSLDQEDCYVNPQLYEDNEELQHDAGAMSELARANIVYDFGDRQEIVDVSVIDGWIVKLADGTFTIDETKVMKYVEDLAARYDTFGLTRQFYTSLGTVETLTGGDYGWCMDQDATMSDLMKALYDGYQGEMEPEYIYTAMSRDTNDIGYTYVEVCISQQRMWCYQDGNLIVDTPVVTGNPNKGNATPSGGVWAIDAKMRDYVLKGEGYTAPVDYWMPFNGDVGIHDMQARYAFGGSIYLSNGSHGCVNTPYEQAQTIYSVVSIGTPVIVYE